MVCPSISPLAAETIRAASNRPRYVDFARPSALTLAELGIATDSEIVRTGQPASAADADEEEPDHPSEDAALGGEEEETRVIPVTDDSLRQPEDLYEEVIEEPEGVLVQFDGGVRTYQTGDGEYTTVVGGYSGLYRSEDGSIREVDNTLVLGDSASLIFEDEDPDIAVTDQVQDSETEAEPEQESVQETAAKETEAEPEETFGDAVLDAKEVQESAVKESEAESEAEKAAELPATGSEAEKEKTEEAEKKENVSVPIKKEEEIRESVTEKPSVSTGDTAQQAFLRSKYAAWVENEAGPVKVKIPLRMSTSRGVSLETEEGKIELIPTSGNFKKPSVSGNAIRFNDVYENVDFQYTVQENTVKGDIFLLEPGDRYEFSYRLKIPGMTAKQEKDKVSVYGKDKTKALFQ